MISGVDLRNYDTVFSSKSLLNRVIVSIVALGVRSGLPLIPALMLVLAVPIVAAGFESAKSEKSALNLADIIFFSPRLIAMIAYQRLSEDSRSRIIDALESHPRFEQDFLATMPDRNLAAESGTQDLWVFLQAAGWPNRTRTLSNSERDKHSRNSWHFISAPIFLVEAQRQEVTDDYAANPNTDYEPGMEIESLKCRVRPG